MEKLEQEPQPKDDWKQLGSNEHLKEIWEKDTGMTKMNNKETK